MVHVGSNPRPLLAGIEADLSGLSPLCSTLVQFWCQLRHSQQLCTEETGPSAYWKSLDAWTRLTRCPDWRLLGLVNSFPFLILLGDFETSTDKNKKRLVNTCLPSRLFWSAKKKLWNRLWTRKRWKIPISNNVHVSLSRKALAIKMSQS